MKKIIFLSIFFFNILSAYSQTYAISDPQDSLQNKIGFDFGVSSVTYDPAYNSAVYSTSIFYKFQHNKIFLGLDYYTVLYGPDLLQFHGGYEYYILDRNKKTNVFLETEITFLDYNGNTEYGYDNSQNEFFNFFGGIGAENKILKWLKSSYYLGVGLYVDNVNYGINSLHQYGNVKYYKDGLNFGPSVTLDFKFNVYFSRKKKQIPDSKDL